jgi:hypothetical protein
MQLVGVVFLLINVKFGNVLTFEKELVHGSTIINLKQRVSKTKSINL